MYDGPLNEETPVFLVFTPGSSGWEAAGGPMGDDLVAWMAQQGLGEAPASD